MSKWKFFDVERRGPRDKWAGTSDYYDDVRLSGVADIAEELAEMLEDCATSLNRSAGCHVTGRVDALLDRFRVQEEQTVEAKLAVLSKQCAWDDINANMVYLAQAIDALRAEVRGK